MAAVAVQAMPHRQFAMHLDFLTSFDNDGINFNVNNRYKPDPGRRIPRTPAHEREEVQMKQGQRIIHFQHSKNQIKERAEMMSRLCQALGSKFPIAAFFPKHPGGYKGSHLERAPMGSQADFKLKRGMVVFEVLDPITGETRRSQVVGASSTYGAHCYNGLPYFMDVHVLGVSQTESIGSPNGVREECVAATSGTDKILNTSILSIPTGVYCYMSEFCCVTTDSNGNVCPVVNTAMGVDGTVENSAGISEGCFLPGIFYLTDNNMYSLEERIDEELTSMFKNVDAQYPDGTPFKTRMNAYCEAIAGICDRRCTTFEMRKDFVLYELATIKAYNLVLGRVDVFKFNRAQYAEALSQAVAMATRVLSFYGRERAEIVAHQMGGFFPNVNKLEQVLRTDYYFDADHMKEVVKEIKELGANQNGDLEGDISDLLNKRWWLTRRLDKCLQQLRAEGHKILKRMYIGKSRESAESGEWFTIEIFA